MGKLTGTKYRVARDNVCPQFWAVQQWRWYWPFWTEVGNGLLKSREEAETMISIMLLEYYG